MDLIGAPHVQGMPSIPHTPVRGGAIIHMKLRISNKLGFTCACCCYMVLYIPVKMATIKRSKW